MSNFDKNYPMKNVLVYSLLGILMICNSGCLKKAKDKITGGTMVATVNGEEFRATNVSAFSSTGHFFIEGTIVGGRQMSIIIPDASTFVSTYTIDSVYHQALYYVNNSAKPAKGVSGTITIHYRSTNSAYGTFAFTCNDGTQVTNGVYDANWP